MQNAKYWFDFRHAQNKQQGILAVILCGPMPDCLVKVVRRKLDDTDAEILHENEQLEQEEIPYLEKKENPAVKCRQDLVRKEKCQRG